MQHVTGILHTIAHSETVADVQVSSQLSQDQRKRVSDLFHHYSEFLSDRPGHTNVNKHQIYLTRTTTERAKAYPVPMKLVDAEVDKTSFNFSVCNYSKISDVKKGLYISRELLICDGKIIYIIYLIMWYMNKENSIKHGPVFPHETCVKRSRLTWKKKEKPKVHPRGKIMCT